MPIRRSGVASAFTSGGGSGGGGAAPAWFTALAHKEWATPVTNWLGAAEVLDPNAASLNGPDGRIDEWTGMGADPVRREIFMLANGGHNGYYGNEVDVCNLGVESPAWSRARDADFPLSPGVSASDVPKNSYGNKTADHSTNLHIAAEGRWFTPGMASCTYLGGARGNQWWEFNRTTNSWVDLGDTHPENRESVTGFAAWDPVDRQIIVALQNIVTGPSVVYQSIDNMSSGTPALSFNDFTFPSSTPMGGVDTTNRVLLLRYGATYYSWSLTSSANKQANPVSNSATGTAPSSVYQMHWHATSGAWITWDGAGGLHKLTPTVSAGNYTALAWSAVAGAGGSSPSGAAGIVGLMYNKINYIADMGDGTAALIVVPRYAFPDVYVMRLTGAV